MNRRRTAVGPESAWLSAALAFMVMTSAAVGAETEKPASPAKPVAKSAKAKAKKARAKKAVTKTAARPAPAPALAEDGSPPVAGALAPGAARLDPILAAAAVSMPPALLAAVRSRQRIATPALDATDLGSTADRLRRGWLLSTPMGPPAGGIAVGVLAATEVGAAVPVATAAPVEAAVWDTHLPATTAVASVDPARRLRVFGHLAVNHWEGERNVGVRAGPRGQTSIWDAVLGVETRLSRDTEVRVRALSILPAVTGDGDGAGPGSPGGAVNFKDYLYMRDVYIGFLNLGGHRQLNLRFGRVPIAFGDEYLQYDAPVNPLVSHSVPFFWGFDEGFQLYGDLSPDISYTISGFLDGELGNGSDETTSKAYGFRLEGNHGGHWHWSLSYHDNGDTGLFTRLPSLYFGRELAAPVGATGAPGGSSRSTVIETEWWEGNVRYGAKRGYLALARGGGRLQDDGIHDRDFEWFKIEPLFRVTRRLELVARYSGMNVEDDRQGYRFNSFETAGTELNFDVNERQRLSVGTRYWVNDAVQVKLEHTSDEWNLIPTPLTATVQLDPEHRDYTVLQAAVTF